MTSEIWQIDLEWIGKIFKAYEIHMGQKKILTPLYIKFMSHILVVIFPIQYSSTLDVIDDTTCE